MSTRACYIVEDGYNCLVVYKHHDGYPDGAVGFIQETLNAAWPLPRFEADEWAAAFAAANKGIKDPTDPHFQYRGGGIRFSGHVPNTGTQDNPVFNWRESELLPGDIEYLYHIQAKQIPGRIVRSTVPTVTGYAVKYPWEKDKPDIKHMFEKMFSYTLGDKITPAKMKKFNKAAKAANDRLYPEYAEPAKTAAAKT